ncbi:hypothetical protein SAMN02745150_01107 [Brevinema andersonii]|uniref:Membrane protein YfhO n=1 Tax=Brevinema andersonii TaxID=34097 RepID=A0A1I1EG85_BREAD|nr:hypothetical protein [Brevinema andersonii]SFB86174.1 hypothetical protein SAMN02745150_01107 [Brevinema andersonii]
MQKLAKQYGIYLFLGTILTVMIALLFRESFSGLILQGTDDNVSMRMMLLRSLQSGQGYHFFPVYWLGYIFNVPNPDLYTTVLAVTGKPYVVWVYIIALVLSGFLTCSLIKRLSIGTLPALFGAISYTFLPHVLSLVYSGHAPAISAIPMTPGFLLSLTIIADGKTKSPFVRALSAIWAGIFWAEMMLGEPQRAIYGTVLGGAWILFLLFQNNSISFKPPFFSKGGFKEIFSYLIAIPVVGLLIFMPTLKFWSNSEFIANEGSWEFSTGWSFPPAELLDSLAFGYHGLSTTEPLFPYYGDKPLSGNTDSLGFFVVVFLIFAVVFAWKNNRNARFFIIAGLAALLLSFGKYFPGTPFYWLWYHLPGMNKLRVPAKFLSITGLSWSIAAAIGLDAVRTLLAGSDKEKTKKAVFYAITAVAALSLLWLAVLIATKGGETSSIRKVLGRDRNLVDAALSGRINSVLNMSVLFLATWALFLVAYFKRQYAKFLPLGVLVLACWNLYMSNRFYIERTYVDEAQFYPKTPLIDFLLKNQDPRYRISGSLYLPNLTESPAPIGTVIEQGLYPENNYDLTYAFPYFDINSFGRIPISRLDEGYKNFFKSSFDSIEAFDSNDSIWEMNKRLWFLGNVKYLLVGSQIEEIFAQNLQADAIFITNLQGIASFVSVYELRETLPRFALFDGVKLVYDLYIYQDLANELKNVRNFRPVAEDTGELPEAPAGNHTVPQVERTAYNGYEVTLGFDDDKILYFGDLADKGWTALLDGEDVSLIPVNGIQQAVFIPAGTQRLEVFYHRPVEGLLFSRIVILVSAAAALALWIWNVVSAVKVNSGYSS